MKKKSAKGCIFTRGKKDKTKCASSCSGCGYFLGFIGALVYYMQNATGFWNVILGILKAIVWPAMLVYKLFSM